MFRYAYPLVLYVGIPLIAVLAWWHWYYYRKPTYLFSFTWLFHKIPTKQSVWLNTWVLVFCMRLCVLLLLLCAIARPQFLIKQSSAPVEGVDIMMVLDVSGSMDMFDDLQDRRSRFEAAKNEAIKFINKRDNDPIGLIVFGAVAVTRCPLTLDKQLLTTIINDTKIGDINADGTVLMQAIAMASHRLRSSQAESKIMIVLTDGTPSAEDIEPTIALDLVKKQGIKVYTIGIGSERGGYVQHTFFGLVTMPTTINKQLLSMIAQTTGGQFFEAKNPQDVSRIYEIIDNLEKTDHDVPQCNYYQELYAYFLLFAVLILSTEIIASLWWGLL